MLRLNSMMTSDSATSSRTGKQPTVPTPRTLLIPDCGIRQRRHKPGNCGHTRQFRWIMTITNREQQNRHTLYRSCSILAMLSNSEPSVDEISANSE